MCTSPLDVVRRLGAMQAQDYGQALWAIGCRLPNGTIDDVTASIEAGEILRTWPQRGTLHFVPAADAASMLQISTERTVAGHRTRLRQLELDDAVLSRSRDVLEAVLSGGQRVARPQLLQLLEEAGIGTVYQRGYTILWHAAHRGLICLGPMGGRQQSFVLLREWVTGSVPLPRSEALTTLTQRYFTSRGPATAHDFAWWASITVTEARQAAAAADGLVCVDGKDRWAGSAAVRRAADEPLLLAGFDEFLLGYQDRSAMLSKEHAGRVVPGGNGVFASTMVLGGAVVGTWRRTVKGKAVDLVLAPFESFEHSDVVGVFTSPAERYAEFIQLPLRAVTVALIGVGR